MNGTLKTEHGAKEMKTVKRVKIERKLPRVEGINIKKMLVRGAVLAYLATIGYIIYYTWPSGWRALMGVGFVSAVAIFTIVYVQSVVFGRNWTNEEIVDWIVYWD